MEMMGFYTPYSIGKRKARNKMKSFLIDFFHSIGNTEKLAHTLT